MLGRGTGYIDGLAVGFLLTVGIVAPAFAGPAGGSTGDQQEQVVPRVRLVCDGDPSLLCPADPLDAGYDIPGNQGQRVLHTVCDPGLAVACVPDVAAVIPGCSMGDSTDCARLTLSATETAPDPSAACFGQPNCLNVEVQAQLEVFDATGTVVVDALESFTHPTGFESDGSCGDGATDAVWVGDWFPFRTRDCVFDEGISWEGLIIPTNVPGTLPAGQGGPIDPALERFETELLTYAAGTLGLPLGSVLPTMMLDSDEPTSSAIETPGQTVRSSTSDLYDGSIVSGVRTGRYALPIRFAYTHVPPPDLVADSETTLSPAFSPGDRVGDDVAVDGDVLVVGAPSRGSIGAGTATVFRHDGAAWIEEQTLAASDGTPGDRFGEAVAVEGERIVVGAPGAGSSETPAASIVTSQTPVPFQGLVVGWSFQVSEELELTALGLFDDGGDGFQNPHDIGLWTIFGVPVATAFAGFGASGVLDGEFRYFATAPALLVPGQTYFVGADYLSQTEDVIDVASISSDPRVVVLEGCFADFFGFPPFCGFFSVPFGPNLRVRSPGTGAAYTFEFSSGTWVEVQRLGSSDSGDLSFGGSVALDFPYAAIGADGAGTSQGAVVVFRDGESGFAEDQRVQANDGLVGDAFGRSVDLSGNRLAVGAPGANGPPAGAGAAYLFARDATWAQREKLVPLDPDAESEFGAAVSLDGGSLLIGSPFPAGSSIDGAAYLFSLSGGTWAQLQKLLSPGASDPQFGADVALAGLDALVGSPRAFGPATLQGSAQLFRFDGSQWLGREGLLASSPLSNEARGASVDLSSKRAIVGAPGRQTAATGAAYAYDLPESGRLVLEGESIGSEAIDVDFSGRTLAFVAGGPGEAAQLASAINEEVLLAQVQISATDVGDRLVLEGIDESGVTVVDSNPGDGFSIGVGDYDRIETSQALLEGSVATKLAGTGQDVVASCAVASGGGDAWYRFTAPSDGILKVDTCGSADAFGSNSLLSLHDVSTLDELACNDDWGVSSDPTRCDSLAPTLLTDSFVERSLLSGESVLVRVGHEASSVPGDTNLNVSFIPEPGVRLGFLLGSFLLARSARSRCVAGRGLTSGEGSR